MNNFIQGVIIGIGLAGLVFVLSIFGGTFLWLVWPVAIPSALPGLVASGIIAAKLSWWQAVCLTWICGILIKSSSSSASKK